MKDISYHETGLEKTPLKTFICYAHEDYKMVEKQRIYLRPFEKSGLIKIWFDGEILAGNEWDRSIKDKLYESDLILLFVSAHFVESNYIEKTELQAAIQRHDEGKAIIIPIILSYCSWQDYFEIGRFQALPNNSKPIKGYSIRDKAYDEVAKGVRKTAEGFSQKLPAARNSPVIPKVFINYNHQDSFAMRSIKASLEDSEIEVSVDIQHMGVGDNIEAFIEKALRENFYILSVISRNSLQSGWVNTELNSALLLSRFGKKWLPVLLDQACFDNSFYSNTLQDYDQKLETLKKNITKAINLSVDIRPFQDKMNYIQDLKNDFGKSIQALRHHLAEDISGRSFETGMDRECSVNCVR